MTEIANAGPGIGAFSLLECAIVASTGWLGGVSNGLLAIGNLFPENF